MDRPVMFVLSLLVLVVPVVAIHVISANDVCECGDIHTMESAYCAGETLFFAKPQSVGLKADASGNPVSNEEKAYFNTYHMFLHVQYQKGSRFHQKLNHTFVLMTPVRTEDCGVQLEIETDYVLSGKFFNSTLVSVHSCDFIQSEQWPEESSDSIDTISDTLHGHLPIQCNRRGINIDSI